MRKMVNIMAVALATAATPAMATDFIFTTTGGGLTATNSNVDGNARTYSAIKDGQTLDVRATGWSNDGTIRDSRLMSYSGGLGVISGDDDATGANNTHTIDNQNRSDFILLQFSQAVTLTSATLNAFAIGSRGIDTDATYAWANSPFAWNAGLPLNNGSYATFSSHLTGISTVDSVALNGVRPLSLTNASGSRASGNLWLIGAAQANVDGIIDAFKLAGFTASTPGAVPEPATWAMMILGFGMVGGATRRRKRQATPAHAHA